MCKATLTHILAECKNVTAINVNDCQPDIISQGRAESGYYSLLCFSLLLVSFQIHSPSSLAHPVREPVVYHVTEIIFFGWGGGLIAETELAPRKSLLQQ